MSETISLHDQVAIEAMSAIIAKAPFEVMPLGSIEKELRVARGAFDYADAFMAVRAERGQSAEVQSLGAELGLLRKQRDEAQGQAAQLLAQVSSLRLALRPLYGFSASHERPFGIDGKIHIVSGGLATQSQYAKLCVALRELLGDPT